MSNLWDDDKKKLYKEIYDELIQEGYTSQEARKYAKNMITEIGLGNRSWPGPEKDVKYFVVLDNGKCVGMHHPLSESGKRRAKYAEFPVYNYVPKQKGTF